MHVRRQVLPPRQRGGHVGARHGEGEEGVHWAAASWLGFGFGLGVRWAAASWFGFGFGLGLGLGLG